MDMLCVCAISYGITNHMRIRSTWNAASANKKIEYLILFNLN